MQIFEGQVRFGIHSGQQHTTPADHVNLWRGAEGAGAGYEPELMAQEVAPLLRAARVGQP